MIVATNGPHTLRTSSCLLKGRKKSPKVHFPEISCFMPIDPFSKKGSITMTRGRGVSSDLLVGNYQDYVCQSQGNVVYCDFLREKISESEVTFYDQSKNKVSTN